MLNAASILAFAAYTVVDAQVTTITPSPEPCSSTTMCTDILKTCGTAVLTYGGYERKTRFGRRVV